MKKMTLLVIMIMLAQIGYSQTPDFTGTWKLNSSLSKLNAEFTFAPNELIIDLKGNDIKVEKHSSFQGENFTINEKFTLDGKECINEGFQGGEKKSKAIWSDDKKTLTVSTKLTMGDGNEMTLTEIYKLDKKNLIISTKASSSYGDVEETMGYDRQ
jgi:hypothetical protein